MHLAAAMTARGLNGNIRGIIQATMLMGHVFAASVRAPELTGLGVHRVAESHEVLSAPASLKW